MLLDWSGRRKRCRQSGLIRSPTSVAGRSSGSAQGIFCAGDEHAGAAGLAPHAVVAGTRRAVVVVAGDKLALVDPQLTVEEMQLLDAGMCMRGVTRARCETHEHADPVPFGVGRQQLAFDPRRDLL